MKKLFTMTACALCAALTLAGDWFPVKISVPANTITSSVDVVLAPTFGEKCQSVDHFTAAVVSGTGTGTVAFISVDHDIETAIATSSHLTSGTLYSNLPRQVAVAGAVTNVQEYLVRMMRVKVIQPATNVVTVYNAAIFTK
jgi:hypothetical protein